MALLSSRGRASLVAYTAIAYKPFFTVVRSYMQPYGYIIVRIQGWQSRATEVLCGCGTARAALRAGCRIDGATGQGETTRWSGRIENLGLSPSIETWARICKTWARRYGACGVCQIRETALAANLKFTGQIDHRRERASRNEG